MFVRGRFCFCLRFLVFLEECLFRLNFIDVEINLLYISKP